MPRRGIARPSILAALALGALIAGSAILWPTFTTCRIKAPPLRTRIRTRNPQPRTHNAPVPRFNIQTHDGFVDLAALTPGVALIGATLAGCDWRGVSLTHVIMERCDFRGADLREATFDRQLYQDWGGERRMPCLFLRCDLRDADLRGADLSGANFVDSDLRGAFLLGAILRPQLYEPGSNEMKMPSYFSGCNLGDADLRGADLSGASFIDSNLHGARYDESTRWPPGFDPVKAGAQIYDIVLIDPACFTSETVNCPGIDPRFQPAPEP